MEMETEAGCGLEAKEGWEMGVGLKVMTGRVEEESSVVVRGRVLQKIWKVVQGRVEVVRMLTQQAGRWVVARTEFELVKFPAARLLVLVASMF